VGGNTGKGVVDVRGVFDGERNKIGPGFGEGIDVLFWFVDEKVDILEKVCSEAGNERGADGDVGPDIAIHDIEVNEVDVVLLEGFEGGVLVAHVSTQGGDGKLRAGADEIDFFGAGHWIERLGKWTDGQIV